MAIDEAGILASLDLGTSKEILKDSPNSPIVKMLTALAQDVTEQLARSLDKYDATASNDLRQSITPTEAVIDGGAVFIPIEANFYWKFIEYGVNGYAINRGAPTWGQQPKGNMTFKDSIKQWVVNRGIKLKETRDDVPLDEQYDTLAYLIMNKIRRDGQAPRPFFTDVVNQKLISVLQEPIERVLERAIEIRIVEPWR